MLTNPSAQRDYEIIEKFQAGIVLRGFEVKAIKFGRGSLRGSYVVMRADGPYLVNFSLPPYQERNAPADYRDDRPRKLLLHKKEIEHIRGKLQERGMAALPLSVETLRDIVKVTVGIGKGMKKYEKREKLKRREFEREKQREEKKILK